MSARQIVLRLGQLSNPIAAPLRKNPKIAATDVAAEMARSPSIASRLLRSSWLWCVLALANCAALLIQWRTGEWLYHTNGSIYPHDYLAQWAAGRRMLEGHADLVYDWRAHVAFETKLIGATKPAKFYFLYPPPFLITTVLFARLNLVPAYLCFLALTSFLYTLALRLVASSWSKAAFASIAGGGAYISLLWVQNGLLTAAIFTAGLAFLPKRPAVAGILFGALTIKPQLSFLIPFALAAGRQWKAIAGACAACICLDVGAAFLFGPLIWPSFFHSLAETRALLESGTLWFKMQSPFALMLPLVGKVPAYGIQAVIAGLVLWIVVGIWRRDVVPASFKSSALLSGSLLVSPYLYPYDAVILSAAVLMLVCQSDDVRPAEAAALIASLLLPGFTETLHSAATPIASLIILLLSIRLSTRHEQAEMQYRGAAD